MAIEGRRCILCPRSVLRQRRHVLEENLPELQPLIAQYLRENALIPISADLQTLENNVRELRQEMEEARQNYTEILKAAQKLQNETVKAIDAYLKGDTDSGEELEKILLNATKYKQTFKNNSIETLKKLNQTETALKEAQKQLEAFETTPAQPASVASSRVHIKPNITSTDAAPKSLTLSTVVLIVAVTHAIASLFVGTVATAD